MRQTEALASVTFFVEHPKYLGREFNYGHCLSHNFNHGYCLSDNFFLATALIRIDKRKANKPPENNPLRAAVEEQKGLRKTTASDSGLFCALQS